MSVHIREMLSLRDERLGGCSMWGDASLMKHHHAERACGFRKVTSERPK